MKRFLFISSAIVFLGSLQSCVKKYCYDCTTVRTETMAPENILVKSETSRIVHCEHTSESIKEVERNGTSFTTFEKAGKVHQEHISTKCVPY